MEGKFLNVLFLTDKNIQPFKAGVRGEGMVLDVFVFNIQPLNKKV